MQMIVELWVCCRWHKYRQASTDNGRQWFRQHWEWDHERLDNSEWVWWSWGKFLANLVIEATHSHPDSPVSALVISFDSPLCLSITLSHFSLGLKNPFVSYILPLPCSFISGPVCPHGLLPGSFLQSYPVFVLLFFFIFQFLVPYVRLS